MKLLCLNAAELHTALPMADAVRVVKQAFAAYSAGRADAPLRTALDIGERKATTLVMPCYLPDYGLGAKLVSVFPQNRGGLKPVIHGLMVLLDPETGEPTALVDGTALTAWRTGAASGAATDLLCAREVRRAAVLGSGAQARTQVLALDTVRNLNSIRVYSRTADRVATLIEKLQPHVSARLEPCESAVEAIRDAGVVCTATTSSTPVLDGSILARGCHVNAIGSFTPEMQEIDVRTVERARVFVDSRDAAGVEAGDLLAAERAGVTQPHEWTELGEVVAGTAPGREGDEITLFKSVGLAVQDVATASEAVARARQAGLGREVEL